MSNLFYSGSGRHTSGAFTVTMKDGAKLAKQIAKLENGGKAAIQRTVSDFNSRAPAWVSKGIRQHYGVDTAAIKSAGPQKKRGATHINVAGVSVDGATLEYKGRTLTPTHFKMSPKSRPTKRRRTPILIPGQMLNSSPEVGTVRPPAPYQITAQIIKGQRARPVSYTHLKQRKREKDRNADRKINKDRARSRGLCSGNLSGDRLHGSEARSQRSGAFTGRNKQAATPDRPAGSRH